MSQTLGKKQKVSATPHMGLHIGKRRHRVPHSIVIIVSKIWSTVDVAEGRKKDKPGEKKRVKGQFGSCKNFSAERSKNPPVPSND